MFARTLLFNVVFYVNFAVQALLFSPFLLLPERYGTWVTKFWTASSLFWHRLITGIGEETKGLENIPQGACIVACKHQSTWETMRLVYMFDKPAYILKRELMWIPLLGWYLKKYGHIPVDRGSRSKALASIVVHARQRKATGYQILIFPEGTRRPPLAEPHYRYGVVHLYKELGLPVVPVALNAGLYWPRRSFAHVPGTVRVQVLPPIEPGLEPSAFAVRLEATLEEATNKLIEKAFETDPATRPPGWAPKRDEAAEAAEPKLA
ncbi:1-acyl-sn-glycerol-3-phosphate acyltransferase [Afifella sp. IM 167]|uniref:lysophospholipid acyltransferase family protein n=1 Tax=Afifella sp. IM 167 TaxID=2033586 RepID=UPI001CCBB793|nr:lysophospholipid acyltransferase family protein [Afifella sp. IM 167]MBZ8132844.1 1-acyl-sn-glycerol-3-phosphate acyltransferase [Afifella sp. IM 167]